MSTDGEFDSKKENRRQKTKTKLNQFLSFNRYSEWHWNRLGWRG